MPQAQQRQNERSRLNFGPPGVWSPGTWPVIEAGSTSKKADGMHRATPRYTAYDMPCRE
jgi:hypothetical protein